MKSRKFILASATFVTATGLLIAGLISADEWYKTAVLVSGLYGTANVAQKYVEK